MHEAITNGWPILLGGLLSVATSAGIVLGTIKAINGRMNREITRIDGLISCVQQKLNALEKESIMKSDCERNQGKCERGLVQQIDTLSAQLAEHRTEQRHDIEAIYTRIDGLNETYQNSLTDFAAGIRQSLEDRFRALAQDIGDR